MWGDDEKSGASLIPAVSIEVQALLAKCGGFACEQVTLYYIVQVSSQVLYLLGTYASVGIDRLF